MGLTDDVFERLVRRTTDILHQIKKPPTAAFFIWWSKDPNTQREQPHVIIQLPLQYRPESKTKIIEYYKNGLSLGEISKRGGGSKTHIRRTLIEAGVEVRSFKKANPARPDVTRVMRSGRTPFGYCYFEGQLVKDTREYQIVLRMWHMRHNGMSYRAIARALNDQRVPTRLSKSWKHEVVKQIIARHENNLKKSTRRFQ